MSQEIFDCKENSSHSLKYLIRDSSFLRKLLGLSNLHYIDPQDPNIIAELTLVCRDLSMAINGSNKKEIIEFWPAISQYYTVVIRSGFNSQPTLLKDHYIFKSALKVLSSNNVDEIEYAKALLISLLFYDLNSIKKIYLKDKIPFWLIDSLKEFIPI